MSGLLPSRDWQFVEAEKKCIYYGGGKWERGEETIIYFKAKRTPTAPGGGYIFLRLPWTNLSVPRVCNPT